jgi:hypothetical protein
MIIVAITGFVIYHKNGLPDRKSLNTYNQDIFYELYKKDIVIDDKCLSYVNINTNLPFYCRYDDVNSQETLAIIGDSHAYYSFLGISEIDNKLNINTLLLGSIAPYRPILGIDDYIQKYNYQEWKFLTDSVFNFIIYDNKIEKVIIIIRGQSYLYNFRIEGDPVNYALTPELYLQTLQSTIDKLVDNNKSVFILVEHPELTSDIRNYLVRPFNNITNYPLKSEILLKSKDYYDLINDIKNATVIDTIDILCPDDYCLVTDNNGVPLYIDNNHLTDSGSKFIANNIIYNYIN